MTLVMNQESLNKALDRLAKAIAESHETPFALVGIRRRGIPLAERLAGRLERKLGSRPEVGTLDIAFYRDDLSHIAAHPQVGVSDLPFSVDDRVIYIVDDVLYTGRTIRAALDALLDFGRPRRIVLVVLIDRGHRELPIQADFVGDVIETMPQDDVRVCIEEIDGRDEVVMERKS
jgi:pyrimidine operon attenuation protein/uracil phosphoribosyltransferase